MTETKYLVSWKSDTQRTRKEAHFPTLTMAEEWYREKLKEGKKTKIWLEETITIVRRLTTAP
jgi:hypothetical protein